MNAKYMTIYEAAIQLGVTDETIKNYVKRGVLVTDGRKSGHGAWQIRRDSVDAYLNDGYDVLKQSQAIEQLKADIAEERIALKVEKERLQSIKEILKIRGTFFNNYFELSGILCSLIDVLGKERLSKREHELLTAFAQGQDAAGMSERFGLTRARVVQIYHKALKRLMSGKDMADLANENKELRDALEQATKDNNEMRKIVQECNKPLPSEELIIPASLVGIESAGLSVRAYNFLKVAEVRNVWELVFWDRKEVMKYRNVGRKTLDELDKCLAMHNLWWGDGEEGLKRTRNPYRLELVGVSYGMINNARR